MATTDDAVDALIEQVRGHPIAPALSIFIDSNHEIITDLMNRHLNLVSRRSPDLSDGQITIFDQALINLTQGEMDLNFTPAIRFFCKEYLGISEGGMEEVKAVLDRYSLGSASFDQSSTVVDSQRLSVAKTEVDDQPVFPRISTADAAFRRLLAVYEQARAEFLAVADNDDQRTINAAKFLRDTVENVIDNLPGQDVDTEKNAEFCTMARTARDTVEKLCGGKKRRFDNLAEAGQRNTSRTNSRNSDSFRPVSRGSGQARDLFNQEMRFGDHLRYRRERSPVQSRRRARERSPARVRIPYGYSRPVDTYYPA